MERQVTYLGTEVGSGGQASALSDCSAISFRLELSCAASHPHSDGSGSPLLKNSVGPQTFVDRHGREWRQTSRSLGAGAFGEVLLGVGADASLVAIKTILLPKIRKESINKSRRRAWGGGGGGVSPEEAQRRLDDLVREVEILTKVTHPNIVNYRASLVSRDTGTAKVIMEFVGGGSLADLLSVAGTLPIGAVRKYMQGLSQGLNYIHSHGIIHRDLKPGNILLTSDGLVKLADFGAAVQLARLVDETIGTPQYMAPELCRGHGVGPASDVWSVGIILCELLTSSLPWNLGQLPLTAFIHRLGNEDISPVIPQEIGPEAHDLAWSCFRMRAEERPTAVQLCQSSFCAGSQRACSKVWREAGAGVSAAAVVLKHADSAASLARQGSEETSPSGRCTSNTSNKNLLASPKTETPEQSDSSDSRRRRAHSARGLGLRLRSLTGLTGRGQGKHKDPQTLPVSEPT
eukprot:Hpha_TRINITY_DN34237_c0_g1::TRINITY_DN34237_c0_g1_i1::g.34400::m.34400